MQGKLSIDLYYKYSYSPLGMDYGQPLLYSCISVFFFSKLYTIAICRFNQSIKSNLYSASYK